MKLICALIYETYGGVINISTHYLMERKLTVDYNFFDVVQNVNSFAREVTSATKWQK